MKILTVVFDLNKGGTQRSAQVFAKGYKKLGHDSRIIALYGLGLRYDEIKNELPVWNQLTELNILQIQKWEPDILHIHSHGPKLQDIKNLVSMMPANCRKIETNVFSLPSPWADLMDVSYQLSRWAQWIFNLQGGNKYRSEIVPNPVDCSSFKKPEAEKISNFQKKYNIPSNAFVIGRIGQSYSGKWSTMLIDIFNNLSEKIPNLYLLIVNPPDSIIQRSKTSKFSSKIIHIPKIIGDDNLCLTYSVMDIMVHIANQGESFGMIFTESILCETPVIALSTPWADNSQHEVIGNGKGGFILHSQKKIEETILKFFHKNKTLILTNGRDHIIENYDYVKVAQRAIDCSIESPINKKTTRSNIINILKKSEDKPKYLTIFFLLFNSNKLRKLTVFSSNYLNLREYKKMIR